MTTPEGVDFRFQLSDWTLFCIRRPLLTLAYGLDDAAAGQGVTPVLPPGCIGMMLRSIPMTDGPVGIGKELSSGLPLLRYVIRCFPRYYIDMAQSFDEYKKKFSSKTRATLIRKVKRFAELSGGQIR